MTPDDFTRDRALCEAATEGPWGVEVSAAKMWEGTSAVIIGDLTLLGLPDGDADFIAAARERLPLYIEECERMTRWVTRWRSILMAMPADATVAAVMHVTLAAEMADALAGAEAKKEVERG